MAVEINFKYTHLKYVNQEIQAILNSDYQWKYALKDRFFF